MSIANTSEARPGHITRNSLRRAIQHNSIYRDHRWIFLDRNKSIDTLVIPPTNIMKDIKTIGYIAKLNDSKTEIINVYLNQEVASKLTGKSIRNNQFYTLYEKCDPILVNNFERTYGKPLLYKNGIGKFNSDNVLVQDFISKQDCFRKLNITRILLAKVINDKTSLLGFTYKYIGEKLQMRM